MRSILIVLFILLNMVGNTKENLKEIISKTHFTSEIKTFNLKNGTKFSSYNSKGTWENNLGNYGIIKCMGTVKKMLNNEIDLNIMCESNDKNGYTGWSLLKRTGNMESGVGYAEIIDSTIPDKDLWIGTKCTYATNYLNNVGFTMQKCPLSNKLYDKFISYNSK